MDFLNTQPILRGAPTELLADGAALIGWLEAVNLIEPAHPIPRSTSAARLDEIAAQARRLREWLRGFMFAWAGRAIDGDALPQLGPLNQLLADDAAFRQIEGRNGELTWTHPRRRNPAQALLQPIAAAIGDLICKEDFRLVRHCEGRGCVLWFLDRTKAGGRRWCSMAICGNRAKADSHRHRQLIDASANPAL